MRGAPPGGSYVPAVLAPVTGTATWRSEPSCEPSPPASTRRRTSAESSRSSRATRRRRCPGRRSTRTRRRWPPASTPAASAPATTWRSSAPPAATSSPPSRRRGWPARRSWCSRCPCACRRSTSSWRRPATGCSSADTTCSSSTRTSRPYLERRPGDPPSVCFGDLPVDDPFVEPDIDPASLAVIQFTSGSTSDPKGVMLPHATIAANLDGIIEATTFTADDVLVSWLPLYHDMGLVGMLILPDDHRRRPRPRPRRRTSWPHRPAGWSGCRPTARPPRRGRTSRGCSRPGRSSGWTRSTSRRSASRSTAPSRSTPRRSRRSSRPAGATASVRVRSSPPSAWPRCRSPAPSRCRWTGCGPTTSTSSCSRPRATRRRAHPTRRMPAGS